MDFANKIVDGVISNATPIGTVYGYLGSFSLYAAGGSMVDKLITEHTRLVTNIHPPHLGDEPGGFVYEITKGSPSGIVKSSIPMAIIGWAAEKADVHPLSNKIGSGLKKFAVGAIMGACGAAFTYCLTHSGGNAPNMINTSGMGNYGY